MACAEVGLDCLTGALDVRRVDIVHDVGRSLNPAVDIGQIEGAFVQGMGLFTLEENVMMKNGMYFTRGPSTYKIPSGITVLCVCVCVCLCLCPSPSPNLVPSW